MLHQKQISRSKRPKLGRAVLQKPTEVAESLRIQLQVDDELGLARMLYIRRVTVGAGGVVPWNWIRLVEGGKLLPESFGREVSPETSETEGAGKASLLLAGPLEGLGTDSPSPDFFVTGDGSKRRTGCGSFFDLLKVIPALEVEASRFPVDPLKELKDGLVAGNPYWILPERAEDGSALGSDAS